jgi:hypothetical protein
VRRLTAHPGSVVYAVISGRTAEKLENSVRRFNAIKISPIPRRTGLRLAEVRVSGEPADSLSISLVVASVFMPGAGRLRTLLHRRAEYV